MLVSIEKKTLNFIKNIVFLLNNMKKILQLRGHHISSVGERRTFPGVSWVILAAVYSIRYANRSRQFFSELSNRDVEVEIISGLDDLCKLDCPLYQYCASNGQDKSSLGIMGRIYNALFIFDPYGLDEKALQKYDLKVDNRLSLTELMLKYYNSLKS